MPLQYPVTRTYKVPYLTISFASVSIVSIIALAVLNVVLQGYDVVTVLRPDPNITESHWWSVGKISIRTENSCDPVSLSGTSNFRTNSSLFSYVFRSTFDEKDEEAVGVASYIANPLSSCTVVSILATVEPLYGIFKFQACSDLPLSLSLASTLNLYSQHPYLDEINQYYGMKRPTRQQMETAAQRITRNTSSPSNIIGVLDALSSEMQSALDLAMFLSKGPIPSQVWTGGYSRCPDGTNATCGTEERRVSIPRSLTFYPNGTRIEAEGLGPFLSSMETPIVNMLIALRDAYHIDLGNIQPSNIHLSKDAFASHIRPDPALSKFAQSSPDSGINSWGVGRVVGSTWVQELLASNPNISVALPSVLLQGNAPAVAKVDYLCPHLRPKRPGSLLTSVFIGTWSMYMALYGMFQFFGPMLDRRYRQRRGAKETYELAFDDKDSVK